MNAFAPRDAARALITVQTELELLNAICHAFRQLEPIGSFRAAIDRYIPPSRCNNVLYVRGAEEEEEDGEMRE